MKIWENNIEYQKNSAQSTEALEYTNCISTEE